METVVIPFGTADLPGIEKRVQDALELGAGRVILDLDPLPVLDAEGVRGLIELLRRARSPEGEIALRASRPDLLRTLAVTALDRLFTILPAAVPEPA